MNRYLSRAEVEALAAPLGISSRTLERYAQQGLIAKSVRFGRAGQGLGMEFRWPEVVATQLAALSEARKHTKSWPRLRHWMWWEGLPIEWERWYADRIPEMNELAQFGTWLQDAPEADRDRAAQELAVLWGNLRKWPYRRQELRTGTVRESFAAWMVEALSGRGLPALAAPFDSDSPIVIGELIERAFAIPALRASGTEVPGEPGQSIAALLDVLPSPAEFAGDFALLTEAVACKFRDMVKAEEGANLYLHGHRLRDEPFLAALSLVFMRWLTATFSLAPHS